MSKDEELEKLLGELGKTDPLSLNAEDEVYIPESRKPKEKEEEIEVASEVIKSEPEPDDLLMLTSDSQNQDLSEVFSDQLKSVISQYGSVFEEIIRNYKKDREQAQEVINNFMDVIATGGKVPRVYLEKVADAVRAKNEIAQTAIRALDSLPKLMSATKNNEIFNQVNMNFDASALQKLLDDDDD